MEEHLRLAIQGVVVLTAVITAFVGARFILASFIEQLAEAKGRIAGVEVALKNGIIVKLAQISESQTHIVEQLKLLESLPQRMAGIEARCLERAEQHRRADRMD